MSVHSVADVEEALRSGDLPVRTLYDVWERRQPVPEPSARKSHGTEPAGPQIPWLQSEVTLGRRFTELAGAKEEFLLVCDAAREILRAWTSDGEDVRTELVRVRMNYASALARLGFTEDARREIEPCASPDFRPVLGRGLRRALLLQLGDIQRESAQQTVDRPTRLHATEEALAFYRRALDTDPASLDALIAVAATSLVLAEHDAAVRAEAHERARQILALSATLEDSDGPRFLTTRARAEAYAVLGQVDDAAKVYEELRAMPGATVPALAEARYRARFLAEALGRPRDFFTRAFPPLQLIVFAGHLPDRPGEGARFPIAHVDAVRERLRATLEALHASTAVVSGAAGADLLLIEAVRARKGSVHLILPWAQDEFRRTSIRPYEPKDGPPLWEPAFDAAVREAATIREIGQFSQPGSTAGWEYMAEVTAGVAVHTARASRLDVQPVALWDGRPGRGPGGTASFVQFWREHCDREAVIVDLPPVAAGTTAVARARAVVRAERPILHQAVKSMLFADIVGYSRLTEQVIPEFVTRFLARVSQLAATSKHAPLSVNTWGDAVYAVFDFARDAGAFALELSGMIHEHRTEWLQSGLYWEEWPRDAAEPVKHPLNIRIGLHAGPVFLHYDPVVRRLGFTGAHVNRAARIEPIAKPGEVYASEEFAALAELGRGDDVNGFVCAYAGSMPLAKGYPGRYRIYRLVPTRRLDIEELAKAVHALYCEHAAARRETAETNPALRPWSELGEDFRDANRAQAADIPTKLRMLGYELTTGPGLIATEIPLTPERVEEASMHEHRRWMAERRRQGWTYAPVRDNARKHHPLIVDYADLPEVEKEKDRDAVRSVPLLVAKAGFRVRPSVAE